MPSPLDPDCLFVTLADHEVDYVLIGGLAAVLHGSTAMTNDADICPANTAKNVARLSEVLAELEARLRAPDSPDGLPFDPHPSLLTSITTLNLHTRCGDLDLTFSPAGIDDYDALKASSVYFELAGVGVHVAALDDIIRSKETADRPKDRATLPILRALRDEIRRSE